MKHLCLLIASNLLASSILFAQTISFETTIRNDFFSYGEYIFTMDNGESIIAGKDYMSGDWGSEVLRLDKVDASGNLLWSNTYPALTLFEAYRFSAVKGTDNTFFINGAQAICDVGTLEFTLIKFDVDGNVLWTRTEADLGVSFIGTLRTANNGGVWVKVSGGALIELDNNGNILETVPVDSVSTYDYNASTGDLVVLKGAYNNRKLLYIEASGNSDEITISEWFGHLRFLDNGTIGFLTNDALKIYDNQLNVIDSLVINGLLNQYTQLISDNQYIYILSGDWNEPFHLLKLDYTLDILDEFISPLFVNHIDVANDYIQMVGREYKHIWAKSISNDFDDAYAYADTDIGIVNILVNNADSICYEPSSNYCNCNYEVEGVKVMVKNFGTETIDYFEVNSLYSCLNDCYDPQDVMMTYDNMNLLPGQVVTVGFPDLSFRGYDSTQLCLYTTRPNELMDKDYSNDEICRYFLYNDIVYEEEEPRPIEIFPNPTTGIFNIRGIPEGEYHIFNAIGQVMKAGQLEYNTAIDISALSQGVYFVSIMVNDEQVVKRLVKI